MIVILQTLSYKPVESFVFMVNNDIDFVNDNILLLYFQPLSKGDWNGEPKGYRISYKLKDAGVNFQVCISQNIPLCMQI
jgi:hypothetical protein